MAIENSRDCCGSPFLLQNDAARMRKLIRAAGDMERKIMRRCVLVYSVLAFGENYFDINAVNAVSLVCSCNGGSYRIAYLHLADNALNIGNR